MTATTTAPEVAPPVDEVAPGIVTRVREGDLAGAAKLLILIGLIGIGATLLASLGLFDSSKPESEASTGAAVHGEAEPGAGAAAGADHADEAHSGESHADEAHGGEAHGGEAHGAGDHGHGHESAQPVKEQALFSYLVAYMFTLSLALGGLFFTLVQHITRAGWSVVVRRIAENLAGLLFPWMLILFLPIALGMDTLYHHWTHGAEDDSVLQGKSGYLSVGFFYVRAVLYFAVWGLLARYFRGTSLKQDETGDAGLTLKMARRSAVGLLLFALSITFAAFDWVMSLDPHWYSTIFGIIYFAGSVMATLAFMTLAAMWLQKRGYLKGAITTEHYHDLGKLLFAFMVFWTYTSFSQYMLIWYANVPEETLWYQHRANTEWAEGVTLPWGWVGTTLVVGHFLFPFAFLMSRHMKRNRLTLTIGAVLLLVMHWFDMQYLIMPNMSGEVHHYGMAVSVWDVLAMASVIALFVGVFLNLTRSAALIPERDPRLPESLHFHNI
jgi:hypothetical protein